MSAGVAQRVRMRDGVELATDIYFPAADPEGRGAHAVIVERTPYGRGMARFREFGALAAARGYVFLCQDVRGRGDSQGHFHMLTNVPDEGQDGEDTLAWALRQPWCNGDIATVGGSFSAANQQALAIRRPAGLRTQILRDSGTSYYHRMLRFHGLFNVGMVLPWVLAQALDSPSVRRNAHARAELQDMRDNLGGWIARLPLRRGESPLAHAPEYEDIYFTMLETSDDVAYWHNPTARLEGRWNEYATDLSVLLITGWFAHHVAANFDKLREFGQRLRGPVCMVIGPWVHSPRMLEATTAGEVDFGPAAGQFGPAAEFWLCWLDAHLGRTRPHTLPRVTYFVMGTGDGRVGENGRYRHGGEWRTSDVWPPAGAREALWHLRADLSLSAEPDSQPSHTEYLFDPADPCPAVGGTNQQNEDVPSFIRSGPWDQRCRPDLAACAGGDRPLCERDDVVSFRSAPLLDALEVTGPLKLILNVASSAPDTDFVVRLIDEYPESDVHENGLALLISEGAVRMRYRGDSPVGDPTEPDAVYRLELELSPTSNVFKARHRLRIDITSSAVPAYDVNPNTGEPLGKHTTHAVARQRIFHGARWDSALLFTSVPG